MSDDLVTREVFWNISGAAEWLFLVLAFLASAIFIGGLVAHLRRILRGKSVALPPGGLLQNLGRTLIAAATNRTIARSDRRAGMMHLAIMWGFITLFVGTIIVALEYDVFQKLLQREHGFWTGGFFLGYELVLDVLGAVFIIGLVVALVRRYGPGNPELRRSTSDLLLPLGLLLIAATGFVVEGTRLAATSGELAYDPRWSPVGFAIASIAANVSADSLITLHRTLWWFHAIIVLAFVAILPFTPKVVHILSATINLLLQELRPAGKLQSVDVEAAFENDEVLGYATIADLTRKDLLDLTSCTECGRCEISCPAHLSGKSLSPRDIVLQLRGQLNDEQPLVGAGRTPQPIIDNSISREEIWACTTCMACVEECPVSIDPLGKILELRRSEVMLEDQYPETYGEVFSGLQRRNNPWNQHPSARLDWAKGLEVRTMADVAAAGDSVEYLFWVGCSAAFDARNQKIARSIVRILNAAGVSFAVLGQEESCSGDPARRMGHEYLYQIHAETNIEVMSQYPIEKVLTICPHCFNTVKNEYPDYGGEYEVVHHTELILDLLEQGRLKLTQSTDRVITYHDSCYLGRHNRIFEAPREILRQLPGVELVEMTTSRENGRCCGAGGGLMWFEEEPGKRVNDNRIDQARTALSAADGDKPATIASACPFCMTMVEDGLGAQETPIEDRDIAELVAEALGA